MNLQKKKWLIRYCYNRHIRFIKDCLAEIEEAANHYPKVYENIIITDHFNAEICEPNLPFGLQSMIKEPPLIEPLK